MIRELHIFDFDGTLFKSPLEPENYSGPDWWRDPVSLAPPCVPIKPGPDMYISSSCKALRRSSADSEVYTVVMTGRMEHFRKRVSQLLTHGGLIPNELILKGGGRTEPYKIFEMAYLLKQFPTIHTIHFWEDRLHHLKSFQRQAEKLGYRFVVHPVRPTLRVCDSYAEQSLTQRVASRWLART